MDWTDWHKQYETSLVLLARLRIVREQIQACLDECGAGPISIVSICAGDGRDVIEALSHHPRCGDVTAWLLDTHAPSLDRARAAAAAGGLERQLQFHCADATLAASYCGRVPADLIIVSGVLGHQSNAGIRRFLGNLPMLCKSGGSMIWNRHLAANQGAKDVVEIRKSLLRLDFEEVHYSVTSRNGFAVGRSRFRGAAAPFDPQRVIFEFIGLDCLSQPNIATGGPVCLEADGLPVSEPSRPCQEGHGRDFRGFPGGSGRGALMSKADVEQPIAACFEAVAEAQASMKAIGSGSWQPTFGQLNAAANAIARRLLAGGDPGDRVAILMKHDGPVLAAMLAVLKAGRIVVVLPTGAPMERSGRIWEDAAPSAIITDASHLAAAERLAGGSRMLICFEASMADEAAENPGVDVAPDACAFLLYTSGSSGQPKAAMQSHRNMLHAVGSYVRELRLVPKDRICLLGPLSGGQGVMTAHCSLLCGATLYPYDVAARGVAALGEWLAVRKISVFISAAGVFRQLARAMPGGATFPHLRMVRLGAEAALRSDLEEMRVICPAAEFVQAYASSETCNISLFRLPPGGDPGDGALPVGRLMEGKSVALLREDGTEAGPGEAGQIAVRSRYLSAGYWGDPVRTEAAFRKADGGDERVFRTGDLGRWRDDGLLVHLGRLDDRRKMLGNWVGIGEIEASLRDQPGIVDGVVASKGAETWSGSLIAWVVARQPGRFDSAALAQSLRKSLPESMIPARIILVDAIPTAPNGKPDRQRLLQETDPAESISVVPPRTELERMVARAWPRITPHHVPGRYDNFFESGGDSLRAVDFVIELSRALGRKIPSSALIEHPTISQLAEAIETGCISGEGQPWLRPWKASLVSLRETGEGRPLLILPGGYMSEGELLVFAGLIPHLDNCHPAFGVRLNLHARRVIPPLTLGGMARAIGRSSLAALGGRMPVVVGECQACPLACEVARWLEIKLGGAPDLVLLDPWHPRAEPLRDAPHPPGVRRYQRLLSRARVRAYAGRTHVICAAEAARLDLCREWWGSRIGPGCRMWEAPGSHHTYLRQHRRSLAKVINDILNEPR